MMRIDDLVLYADLCSQRVPCTYSDDAAQIPLPPAHIDYLPANPDLLSASTADCSPTPAQGSELNDSLPEDPAAQFDFEYCVGCNLRREPSFGMSPAEPL
jgi:hypothetical protein